MVRSGPGCKLSRRQTAEARVDVRRVLVGVRGFDDAAGLEQPVASIYVDGKTRNDKVRG